MCADYHVNSSLKIYIHSNDFFIGHVNFHAEKYFASILKNNRVYQNSGDMLFYNNKPKNILFHEIVISTFF